MIKKIRPQQDQTDKIIDLVAKATEIDAYRVLVFPNHIRKYRTQLNIGSLLELSENIDNITYIRLSKIERGEVFARSNEIIDIAKALRVAPTDLLVDIDDPNFDIAEWAEPFLNKDRTTPEAERFAVYLAAALRLRRASDDNLTISALEQDYGLAPVILSRIENALKPLERWNEDIRAALRRLFNVDSDTALIRHVNAMQAKGDLDAILPQIANPQLRVKKSRTRIGALRKEIESLSDNAPPIPSIDKLSRLVAKLESNTNISPIQPKITRLLDAENTPKPVRSQDTQDIRKLLVYGTPLANGLIAKTPINALVGSPRKAGPRSYGLKMCRPTLGVGLPGKSTLIVDPDVFPSAGGLAVISSNEGLRVVSVTFDRHGKMLGYSQNPDLEILIDDVAPSNIATVVAAIFE